MNPNTAQTLCQIGIALFSVLAILCTYGSFHFSKQVEKAKEETLKITRPYIDIKPDKIEYSHWTMQEKNADPKITERCDKIYLYFSVVNTTNIPASVDISAIAYPIIEDKIKGNIKPSEDWKAIYEHNTHLLAKDDPGRQPFTLALDKKAVDYFKKGIIKAKLVVKVKYNSLGDTNDYWTEEAYMYSPIFKNGAKEIYSRGI